MKFCFLLWVQLSYDFGKMVPSGPPKDIFAPIVVPMVWNKSLKSTYDSKSSSTSTLLTINNLEASMIKGNNNFSSYSTTITTTIPWPKYPNTKCKLLNHGSNIITNIMTFLWSNVHAKNKWKAKEPPKSFTSFQPSILSIHN